MSAVCTGVELITVADVAASVTMQLVELESLIASHISYHCSRLKVTKHCQ